MESILGPLIVGSSCIAFPASLGVVRSESDLQSYQACNGCSELTRKKDHWLQSGDEICGCILPALVLFRLFFAISEKCLERSCRAINLLGNLGTQSMYYLEPQGKGAGERGRADVMMRRYVVARLRPKLSLDRVCPSSPALCPRRSKDLSKKSLAETIPGEPVVS